jgi:DNA-binding NarL/FixJ family response regulator
MKPRLILADDHTLFLEGLKLILNQDFDVVDTVIDGRALIDSVEKFSPDLVVLDIGMPLLNGLEAMRQLRERFPELKLVVASQRSDVTFVRAAFEAGARGYVLKQSGVAEFRDALRAVLAGDYFLAPALTALTKGGGIATNPAVRFGAGLTSRQREVLQLIAEGKSAKEVAAILRISPKTVEFHKASIVESLGIRTTAELTRYALENGIAVP